jgi:3-dehydroquinate dehydratase type I
MTAGKMFKKRGCIVGVITTLPDLRRAARMADPPDLFEIRLDHLAHHLNELEAGLSMLRRPLIITARDPREGGANKLPLNRRRELLLRFLALAKYLDVELRSARDLRPVLRGARNKKVGCIISLHDFEGIPSVRSLHTKAKEAKRAGADIFKVALRVDRPAQLVRLLQFAKTRDVDLPLSVMGVGRLGAKSRRLLAGVSVLSYAAIGKPKVKGQSSLAQLRKMLARLR